MSDIVSAATLGSCYVSEEASWCVAGTERRCYPISDSIEPDATQAEIDRKNLRVRPFDILDPIKGFKDGSIKLGHYIQPGPTVLVTGATVDTDAQCPLAVFLRCTFGAESAFAGTTVLAASGAVGGFTTAAGHGSRFPAGQLCLVTDPDVAVGLVPARITSRIADVCLFYPNVSGALADGAPVVNLRTYYPSSTNTKSLSVAVCAAQDANHQWRFNGCTGNVEIKVDREGLAQLMFDLKAATWTGPEALGLAITDVADPMAAPLSCRNATCYFQAQSTTTRANYVIDSFSAKMNFGMTQITSLTGSTEGKRGVARTTALTDTFAEIEVTFALATVPDATWWASRTELCFMLWLQVDVLNGGGGYDRRSIVIDIPRAIVVGKPKYAKGSDGLIKTTVTLRAKRDDSCAQDSELSTAPFRLGIG